VAALEANGVTAIVRMSGPSGYMLVLVLTTVLVLPPPKILLPISRTFEISCELTPPDGAKNVKIHSPPLIVPLAPWLANCARLDPPIGVHVPTLVLAFRNNSTLTPAPVGYTPIPEGVNCILLRISR
jgi:hypothetical protein